jgi:hypothetical protein
MPNSGKDISTKSPQTLSSELKHSLSEYLSRAEPRTLKQEIALKDKIIQISFEAVGLLEAALLPGPQLKFWAEEYEEARLDLLRKHKSEKEIHTEASREAEKKALERFANATKMLAIHAASALRIGP